MIIKSLSLTLVVPDVFQNTLESIDAKTAVHSIGKLPAIIFREYHHYCKKIHETPVYRNKGNIGRYTLVGMIYT